MPVDFTAIDELIAREKVSVPSRSDPGKVYNINEQAIREVALEVVKVNFPDWIKSSYTNVKVAPAEMERGIKGDYTPLTHSVRLNKRAPGYVYPAVRTITQNGRQVGQEVNFSTTEVMDQVNTILHELVHAQGSGGWSGPQAHKVLKDLGIGEKEVAAINKKFSAPGTPFFSSRPDFLDVEEFIANAIPLQEMAKRKMLPEAGRLAAGAKALEEIIQDVPQAQQLIDAMNRRDVPTLKPIGPSFADTVKAYFK